jgi:hypothetical protein
VQSCVDFLLPAITFCILCRRCLSEQRSTQLPNLDSEIAHDSDTDSRDLSLPDRLDDGDTIDSQQFSVYESDVRRCGWPFFTVFVDRFPFFFCRRRFVPSKLGIWVENKAHSMTLNVFKIKSCFSAWEVVT